MLLCSQNHTILTIWGCPRLLNINSYIECLFCYIKAYFDTKSAYFLLIKSSKSCVCLNGSLSFLLGINKSPTAVAQSKWAEVSSTLEDRQHLRIYWLTMATNKSSKVWEYFEKVKDDPKKVKCKLCRQLLSYHTTTTNMACHLKQVRLVNFTKKQTNKQK